MDYLVNFQDVRMGYGALEVLKGVSFQVPKGNVAVLIGRSGSGKSTALRCINGLAKIKTGRLEVCGRELGAAETNLHDLRKEVGIVFQSYNLFPHLTVEENVTLAPRLVKRMSRADAREVARRVLQQVGLYEKASAYPEQLSGGQQQRVAIARSLAMSPQVMLFDEVTSALDPELTGEVLRTIEALAKGGMTMVLVTHEMSFAKRIADTIIFMHEGVVWEIGDSSILVSPRTPELKKFISSDL